MKQALALQTDDLAFPNIGVAMEGVHQSPLDLGCQRQLAYLTRYGTTRCLVDPVHRRARS